MSNTPAAPAETLADRVYDAIEKVVRSHSLQNWQTDDGDNLRLLDHLSSGDTIESGHDEIRLLCDAIYNEVLLPMLSTASLAGGDSAYALVQEQAKDHGLWFVAPHASEAYLQQALRALHAAVERDHSRKATAADGGDSGLPEYIQCGVEMAREAIADEYHDNTADTIVYLADRLAESRTTWAEENRVCGERRDLLEIENARLKKQLSQAAADTKDAARYRFLRGHTELCLTGDDHGLGPETHYESDLDGAIDYAMSLSPQSPEDTDG